MALIIIYVAYDYTPQSNYWDLGTRYNKIQQGKYHNTGFKQTGRLARLSEPPFLEVKQNVVHDYHKYA